MSFNPLQFVVNILQSCGSLFYNVWNSLNAWELLLTMVIAFLSFRMIIAPLFGVRLSIGSDKVKQDSLDRTAPRYVDKYGSIRMRK